MGSDKMDAWKLIVDGCDKFKDKYFWSALSNCIDMLKTKNNWYSRRTFSENKKHQSEPSFRFNFLVSSARFNATFTTINAS